MKVSILRHTFMAIYERGISFYFTLFIPLFVVLVSAADRTAAYLANLRRLRRRYRSPRGRGTICIIPFAASLSTRLRFFMHFLFLSSFFLFLFLFIFFFFFLLCLPRDTRRFSRIILNSVGKFNSPPFFFVHRFVNELHCSRWSFEIIEGYSISFDR